MKCEERKLFDVKLKFFSRLFLHIYIFSFTEFWFCKVINIYHGLLLFAWWYAFRECMRSIYKERELINDGNHWTWIFMNDMNDLRENKNSALDQTKWDKNVVLGISNVYVIRWRYIEPMCFTCMNQWYRRFLRRFQIIHHSLVRMHASAALCSLRPKFMRHSFYSLLLGCFFLLMLRCVSDNIWSN